MAQEHCQGAPAAILRVAGSEGGEQLFPEPRSPLRDADCRDILFVMLEGDFQVGYALKAEGWKRKEGLGSGEKRDWDWEKRDWDRVSKVLVFKDWSEGKLLRRAEGECSSRNVETVVPGMLATGECVWGRRSVRMCAPACVFPVSWAHACGEVGVSLHCLSSSSVVHSCASRLHCLVHVRVQFERPGCLATVRCGSNRSHEWEGGGQAFKGVWRMQSEGGNSKRTRLSYSVFVRPQMWLPVQLIQSRIEGETQRNLVAVRLHSEALARAAAGAA